MKHLPKKQLGQNFLNSVGALELIIKEAELSKEDCVLEIGPGKGVLTEKLLLQTKMVVAVEKDRDLLPFLNEKFEKEIREKKLVLVEGDVRDIDIQNYLPQKYKLVANIPYYLTGDLLKKTFSTTYPPKSMVLLLQKEVAQRITDLKKSSILAVSVWAYGEPKFVKTVKRGSFQPVPNVDSAILSIKNISKKSFEHFQVSEEKFFKVLKAGFAHKRKKLRKNLGEVFPDINIENLLKNCELSNDCRAEELNVNKWFCLSQKL